MNLFLDSSKDDIWTPLSGLILDNGLLGTTKEASLFTVYATALGPSRQSDLEYPFESRQFNGHDVMFTVTKQFQVNSTDGIYIIIKTLFYCYVQIQAIPQPIVKRGICR